MQTQRFGGSFAPPITAQKFAEYEALMAVPATDELDLKVKSTCKDLLKMLKVFQETPASALPGSKHPSGRGTITPLEPAEIKRIDPVVPWDHECEAYKVLFDQLLHSRARKLLEFTGDQLVYALATMRVLDSDLDDFGWLPFRRLL